MSCRMWPGAFADDHLDNRAVAEAGAGDERVGDVVFELVVGGEDAGDAALGVVAVGLFKFIFGDDERGESAIDGHRRAHACDAAADDEDVDEVVRHSLGVEGREVAWDDGHGLERGDRG